LEILIFYEKMMMMVVFWKWMRCGRMPLVLEMNSRLWKKS